MSRRGRRCNPLGLAEFARRTATLYRRFRARRDLLALSFRAVCKRSTRSLPPFTSSRKRSSYAGRSLPPSTRTARWWNYRDGSADPLAREPHRLGNLRWLNRQSHRYILEACNVWLSSVVEHRGNRRSRDTFGCNHQTPCDGAGQTLLAARLASNTSGVMVCCSGTACQSTTMDHGWRLGSSRRCAGSASQGGYGHSLGLLARRCACQAIKRSRERGLLALATRIPPQISAAPTPGDCAARVDCRCPDISRPQSC